MRFITPIMSGWPSSICARTRQSKRFISSLRRCSALPPRRGRPDRYHETITWAYLFLIRERMARAASAQTWEQFAQQNPDLLVWRPSLLEHYYRKQTLDSNLARKTFLFPDRIASEQAP
jgi:hypothetical protein